MTVLSHLVLAFMVMVPVQIYIFFPPPPLSARVTEWKRKGQYVNVNGKKIFYIDEKGSGSYGNLVCLHGYPTSSLDWTKVLPEMKTKFKRIVMFDFIGFGFSDKPGNITYTISEQADVTERLLQKLGIKTSHVLSHDYGDTVALEILSRHNNKALKFSMTSLTMMNGGVFQESHRRRWSQKALLLPVAGYVLSHISNLHVFQIGFGEVFGEIKPTKEDFEDFWSLFRFNNGDRKQYLVINFLREREQNEEKWVGALKGTDLKVLMIYGPADPVNPPIFANHWRKSVPQHKIVQLGPGIGHYPQWEDPEACNKEIFQFMESFKV